MNLSLDQLSMINFKRVCNMHPTFPEDDEWNLSDWSNAMGGEAGEAQNVVKKIRRLQTSKQNFKKYSEEDLNEMLASELADVIIYLDLLASKRGIDLSKAVIDKFNAWSQEMGFPERLRDETDIRYRSGE